jgi:hypothetical protein
MVHSLGFAVQGFAPFQQAGLAALLHAHHKDAELNLGCGITRD